MIQLRKLPEALRAGWAKFRSTLSVAPRTHSKVFITPATPREEDHGPFINGDMWINSYTFEMSYYLSLGKEWKPLRYDVRTMEKK